MPLTFRTNGSAVGNIVQASWWDDYYNLFTGAMNDQPVTISYAPSGAGTTPALELVTNGNAPLLQGYNGGTQVLQVDQNGKLSASGSLQQLGDGIVGRGNSGSGLNASAGYSELGGASGAFLKFNNYYDGTNDRALVTGFTGQVLLDGTGETGWRWRAGGSVSAGAAITWGAWKFIALMDSAGGGAAGAKIWVGTTDPGGSAGEGDLWFDG